jgi:hypothetical protein
VAKIKKIRIWFAECPQKTLGKDLLCWVPDIWHSTKNLLCRVPAFGPRQRLTAVSCRRALMALCRAPSLSSVSIYRVFLCAECPALGKQSLYRAQDFAECGSRQRRLCRVPEKKHSAKRLALGKDPDSGSERRTGLLTCELWSNRFQSFFQNNREKVVTCDSSKATSQRHTGDLTDFKVFWK